MSSNNVYETKLSRGKTGIRSTGEDSSSFGEKNVAGIKNTKISGNARDISSSIVDGKVRSYANERKTGGGTME